MRWWRCAYSHAWSVVRRRWGADALCTCPEVERGWESTAEHCTCGAWEYFKAYVVKLVEERNTRGSKGDDGQGAKPKRVRCVQLHGLGLWDACLTVTGRVTSRCDLPCA